jgi:hypothetical protein
MSGVLIFLLSLITSAPVDALRFAIIYAVIYTTGMYLLVDRRGPQGVDRSERARRASDRAAYIVSGGSLAVLALAVVVMIYI